MAFKKILICCFLYQFILSSINNIDSKSVELIKSNTTNPSKNEKIHSLRQLNNYVFTEEQIQQNIDEINSFLIQKLPCRILKILAKKIINNEITEPQAFYSLEIKHKNGKYKYYLYVPKYRKYGVNVDSCETVNIIPDDDSIPINYRDYYKDEDHILSNLNFLKNAQNISEAYSPINKDPCYQVSILDYYSDILDKSIFDLNNIYVSLCDEGCFYEGINIEKLEIRCYCKQNIDMNKLSTFDKIKKYFKNFGNFKVLQCYELFIYKNGQRNNVGSNIILALIIINIICFIHIIISTCANEYYELILKYKNYNGQKIFNLRKIKDLNSIDLSFDSLSNEQAEIIDNFYEYINSRSHFY